MPDENVDKKLQDMDVARARVKEQIDQSQAVLDAIEEKIETVKRQSKQRLLQDDRVDNKLVRSATAQSAKDIRNNPKLDAVVTGSKENVVLVPNTLTEADITVTLKNAPAEQDKTDS